LDDGDGRSSGRGVQRRRLALLTLIGLSPGRRITRDKALATLWPENTSAEGRRRLSSAVYDLRNLLGDDAIESVGDELSIAPSAELRIDVEEFEGALARGDPEAALAAYAGPLLDGVHLSGAGEFEEWIAALRLRLGRLYLQALEQAASARLSRADTAGASTAALQLVDLDPLSGHAAVVAVNTLAAAGDRPHALRIADAHVARVRRELGAAPDDALTELVQRLRATPELRNSPPTNAASTSPLRADRPVAADPSPILPTEAAGDDAPMRRLTPRLLGAAAAALLVAAVVGAAYRSRALTPDREVGGTLGASAFADAATRSTTSQSARQAFVDGENAYENGRYDSAVKLFHNAVVHDSAFALAHVRLSESLLWQEQPAMLAGVQDSLALLWSSTLPDHERLLVRGYVAWRRGEYEIARSLDSLAVRRELGDPEAAFQLGEVLFHYNPMRGRSIGEAWDWFENAAQLDSANWGARWHLLLLDAAHLSASALHDRAARLLAARPDGHVAAELRLFAADNGELPRLAATASGAMLFDAAWRRAIFRRDLAGAESLLMAMTDARRSDYERTTGSRAAAALHFARGSVDAAVPMLAAESGRPNGGDAWVLLVHGLLANRSGAVRLDTLPRAIDRWRQSLDGFGQPTHAPAVVSRYVDGLLAAERGDSAEAMRAAAELDEMSGRRDPYLASDFRNPRELAQTIRAYRDYRRGRCEDALRALDTEKKPYWLGTIASSQLAAQSFEHYIRAECLLALGRNAEAVSWFETFEQSTLYDLEFLGPALRGQAAAHRALGEPDAAAEIEARAQRLR
jgi:DNA-binding SARP family transcriptional activator